MTMKTQPYKIKSRSRREVHNDTDLPQETRKISYLNHHLKELEKEQTKHKVSRRKEIIKIREEIHEIEIRKQSKKISKAKSWFFERVNKTNKPLAKVTKKERGRTQINKIRKERGERTTDTTETQKNHERTL